VSFERYTMPQTSQHARSGEKNEELQVFGLKRNRVDARGTCALQYADNGFAVRANHMDLAAAVRQQPERLVYSLHRSGMFLKPL